MTEETPQSSTKMNTKSSAKVEVHPKSKNPNTLYEMWFNSGTKKWKPVPNFNQIQRKQKSGKIRIVAISDTHNKLRKVVNDIPACDILIHGGDFTMTGRYSEIVEFNHTLGTITQARHQVVISGNHEVSFDPACARHFGSDHDLCNPFQYRQGWMKVCGLRIWGSPWQPTYCGWGFNEERGERILRHWNKIPDDTDILVTHGPPLGHGDLCATGVRAGCAELLSSVEERVRPAFHIFGHIHENYGVSTNGDTTFINACTCTRFGAVTHGPPLGHGDLCATGVRAGCAELLSSVEERVRPAFHIFGHIHENYGVSTNGDTTFINACTCTRFGAVTHGPPLGHGDLCATGVRAGCAELLSSVEERVRPAFHIFGHIHENYGVSTNGDTTFINACTCTRFGAVTHGPPLGHGDLCATGVPAGCAELLSSVEERVRPAFHIFGHIHENYGVSTNGDTTFINACTCTRNYKPCNAPIVFDVPRPKPPEAHPSFPPVPTPTSTDGHEISNSHM